MLDVGCGSGVPIGRYLVERHFSVTGVDSAPEMIALFEANVPNQDARVEDMRSLKLERRFDGLIAWDSFFHLAQHHQRSMFGIFREHAAPRATLMFTSGPAAGESIGTLEGEPLYHASLAGAEYRTLLEEHGFMVVAQIDNDPNCGGRTVWLSRRR